MYRVIISTGSHEPAGIEKLLFSLGASSISLETRNGSTSLCVLVDDPADISRALDGMEYTVEPVGDDWKYNWMKTSSPAVLSDDMLAVPEGYPVPDEMKSAYRHIITLDPSDAFGDGHHPTTRMCIGLLRDSISKISGKDRSGLCILDAGTGTGVLAIAASLLGAGTVDAIDIEEESVMRAEYNKALNRVTGNLNIFHDDATGFDNGRKYNIVIANLLSKIIEQCFDHLRELTIPGGTMILSGVSSRWNTRMMRFFAGRNLIIEKTLSDSDWSAYLIRL